MKKAKIDDFDKESIVSMYRSFSRAEHFAMAATDAKGQGGKTAHLLLKRHLALTHIIRACALLTSGFTVEMNQIQGGEYETEGAIEDESVAIFSQIIEKFGHTPEMN